jgi:hypothetical protein
MRFRVILATAAVCLGMLATLPARSSLAPAATPPRRPTSIRSIRIRVVTQDVPNAGFPASLFLLPAGEVWLDLGPQAWQLVKPTNHGGLPFARGATDEFTVCGSPATCGGYTVDDLLQVRLEKKGLGGLTGAADGPDGGWMPKEVTLFVNDAVFAGPIRVLADGQQLDHARPAWRHLLKPGADARTRFLWGLRAVPNSRPSGHLDEWLSFGTSIFKKSGISGWQPGPMPTDEQLVATVEGELYAAPSSGADGFVTLDLQLRAVILGSREVEIGSPTGIPHPRYIRVEYVNGDDMRHAGWRIGTRLRVTGPVRWDTDRDGFFEIHPTRGEDLVVVTSR